MSVHSPPGRHQRLRKMLWVVSRAQAGHWSQRRHLEGPVVLVQRWPRAQEASHRPPCAAHSTGSPTGRGTANTSQPFMSHKHCCSAHCRSAHPLHITTFLATSLCWSAPRSEAGAAPSKPLPVSSWGHRGNPGKHLVWCLCLAHGVYRSQCKNRRRAKP